jgi:hypothetical protein
MVMDVNVARPGQTRVNLAPAPHLSAAGLFQGQKDAKRQRNVRAFSNHNNLFAHLSQPCISTASLILSCSSAPVVFSPFCRRNFSAERARYDVRKHGDLLDGSGSGIDFY